MWLYYEMHILQSNGKEINCEMKWQKRQDNKTMSQEDYQMQTSSKKTLLTRSGRKEYPCATESRNNYV